MKPNVRLLMISVLLLVSPASFAKKKVEFFLTKDIRLSLTSAPFIQSKHRLGRCGKESICFIDGRPFFGSDGQLPKTELKSMVLTIKGKKVPLDVSGMYQPWNIYKGRHYISLVGWASPTNLRQNKQQGMYSDGGRCPPYIDYETA